jgi:hypothetical protein
MVEPLEDRAVPTVCFTPVFGAQTLGSSAPYQTLSSPPVYLIFWGPSWTASQVNTLSGDAQNILNSHYLNGLTEYGSNGLANYQATWIDNSAVNGLDGSSIQAEITKAINDPFSPIFGPSTSSLLTNPIYAVITDPADSTNGNGGWNGGGSYNSTPINMIYVGTSSGPDEYAFGLTFSHEMAERMSDPTGNTLGVTVYPPSGIPSNLNGGLSQIGDNEPEPGGQPHYDYRIGGQFGTIVQPYWSNANGAFIVTDGNSQTIIATAIWSVNNNIGNFSGTYNLTIPCDGTLTINENGSGLFITLNGQNFYFNPGEVRSITVNEGSGNDTVNIEGTVSGDPVTINEGSGTDTVNISPAAEFLDRIQGNVFVNGGSGHDTLNVYDHNDVFSDTWTLTGSSMTRTGSATINYNLQNDVYITGGTGNLTYNILSTEAWFTTHLDTGPGIDTVNVLSTAPFSTLDIDNLYSTSNHDTVNIGSKAPSLGGTLQNIAGTVNVNNTSGGGTALNIDDSGDHTGRTGTISGSSVTGFGMGGTINYTGSQMTSLTVRCPSATSTVDILGTSTATTVHTEAGTTTVNVLAASNPLTIDGDGSAPTVNIGSMAPGLNGTLANITATVTVTNSSGTLNVDDSGDKTARSPQVSATAITGLGFGSGGSILYDGSALKLSSLVVRGGTGDTWTVTGTSCPTTLHTGAGPDNVYVKATTSPLTINGDNSVVTIKIGSNAPGLSGTLSNIFGAVTVTNTSAASTLTLDDDADPSAKTATITSTEVSGLSPAPIFYNGSQLNSLTVLTGAGGAKVTVAGTSTKTVLTGNAAGANTLVGPNAATTWDITGSNAGSIPGLNLSFSAIKNLTGGTGADDFVFSNGAGVTGAIDGGGGTDALDYSAYTTNVIVDLVTGAATGVGGGVKHIKNVTGGHGAGGYNLLVGNGGNVLTGGNGRSNFLIAGATASTLIGGDGQDILIAGTTKYDNNLTALEYIMATWTGPGTYQARVKTVTGGSYKYPLNATKVFSNGGGNILKGKPSGSALDLYFANLSKGDTTDATAADKLIKIF